MRVQDKIQIAQNIEGFEMVNNSKSFFCRKGDSAFLTSKATQSFVLGQIHKMATALEVSLNVKEPFNNCLAKASVFLLETATIISLLVTTPIDFALKTGLLVLSGFFHLIVLVIEILALGILGRNHFDKESLKKTLETLNGLLVDNYKNFGRDIVNNFRTMKELVSITSPLNPGENEYLYLFRSRITGPSQTQSNIYKFLEETLPYITQRISDAEKDSSQENSLENDLDQVFQKMANSFWSDRGFSTINVVEFIKNFCVLSKSKEQMNLNHFYSIILNRNSIKLI